MAGWLFCDDFLRFRAEIVRIPATTAKMPVGIRNIAGVKLGDAPFVVGCSGAWLEADCLAAESLEVEMQP